MCEFRDAKDIARDILFIGGAILVVIGGLIALVMTAVLTAHHFSGE